jgi:type IV pilus assembly protein PilN
MRVVGPRDKAVALVQNLEHSRRFLQPRITGESAESAANGQQQQLEPVSISNRVNFDLLADYNPALPGERKSAPKKAETEQPAQTAVPIPAAASTPRTGSPGRQRTPYAGQQPTGRPVNHRTPGGPR